MPDPIRASRPQIAPVTTASPAAATAIETSNPEQVREAAAGQAHRMSARRSTTTPLARAFARQLEQAGGSASMTAAIMLQDADVTRSVAGMSERQLRGQLQQAGLNAGDAAAVAHEVAQGIQRKIEAGMRPELQARVDAHVLQLTTDRDALLQVLEAPEGTSLAMIGDRIAHTRGTTRSELAGEVRELFDDQIETFRGYRGRLTGQTWEAGDFPELAKRVARESFGPSGADSIAGRALRETSLDHEADEALVDGGLMLAESAHLVTEVAEAVGHLRAAEGVAGGIALVGVGVSFWMHHEAHERHEAFVASVRRLAP